MKKFWQLWLTAVFAALLLTACGSSDEPKKEDATEQTGGKTAGDAEQAAPAFPVTLTDAVGNEITFEEAPKKIVSLQASNTEILFALGLNDEIVGVTDFDNYPEEALEKEKVGGMQFNVEQIIAMGPDVVFANEMGQSSGEEGWQQIRDAGIPVFVVKNAMNFNETYETIKTIGEATGKKEEAEKIVTDMKAKVDEVVAKTKDVETKRVFVETSDAPDIYAPGKGTFMQEMLDMIGAENVVTADGWALISPEEIVKQNPDVIIVMYSYVPDIVKSVKNRDGFSDITAVKEDRVIQVDENMTSRTGPRLALGLEEVAKAIYPEAFGE